MKVNYLEVVRMQARLEKVAAAADKNPLFDPIDVGAIRDDINRAKHSMSPKSQKQLGRALKGTSMNARRGITENFIKNQSADVGKSKPFFKGLGRMGRGAAGTAAIGGAVALGAAAADKIQEKATYKKRYRAMMDAYPSLKTHGAGAVKKRFDALHRFGGPQITASPIAAGSFIKRTMELGGDMDVKSIAELAKARKDMSAIGKEPIGKRIRDLAEKGIKAD